MDMSGPLRQMIVRSSLVLLLAVLSGCSIFVPAPPEPSVAPEPAPLPQPGPVTGPVTEPAPEPLPPVKPEPVVPAEPQNIGSLVAVVISNRTPAYVDLSLALDRYLDRSEIYDLSDRSMSHRDAFAAISASGADAVVAVGLTAAQAAKKYATVPVVIGQVYNINGSELLSDNIKVVAVLPPIELQIRAWRDLDPTLRNVGAILGPGHEDLIAEADLAMSAKGIKFHYAIAESDRETLYLFNRLVRDIDGFILFPDNRILSRDVLSEMLRYASRHRVQVAVFNEPLLDHGATFNAGTVFADIAATIARILEQIIDGNIDAVPPVTGLTKIAVRTNPAALRRLGLAPDYSETGNTVAGNK